MGRSSRRRSRIRKNRLKYDGGGLDNSGTVTLFINDKKVGRGRVDKTIYGRFSADETFDIGLDSGSPVSNFYQSPFRFTGAIKFS
jgi:hypothetical protein